MNDEQLFLANAYVDGELTADERGIAEADPVVMAEVVELRALQSELRTVEPPTDDARNAAIAAAMAEFTAGADGAAETAAPTVPPIASSAPTSMPAAPNVVPLHRRSWFRPTLTVAAAAVGVGFFAVVINQSQGSDDDMDAAVPTAEEDRADEPADDAADEGFGEFESAESEVDAGVAEAESEPAQAAADDMAEEAADEMAEEPAAEPADEPADEPAEEPAEEPASEPTEGDGGGPVDLLVVPGGSPDNPIVDEFELTTYAAGLIRNRDLQALPPSPNHACANVTNHIANGFIASNGDIVEALIEIADGDAFVTAWSLDDAPEPCSVLLEAPLPPPDS